MKKYGVIMAGGGGTRFWPLSRKKTPKQLLNLTGRDLMVNEAVERLSFTVDNKDIFIVTNEEQTEQMKRATSGKVPADHILSEPSARNTAACIGYAAMEIVKKYGDGIMVITPSDSYIRDTAAFTRTLGEAVKAAEQGSLVTIGIAPSFPATGYGYIRYDKNETAVAKHVKEFKEKPDGETARKYLKTGEYVWNSGMFIWKAGTVLEAFRTLTPDIYEELVKIGDVMNTPDEYAVLQSVYPRIRSISVDYAIMEPAAAQGMVLVVPGDFGWSDVGSWDMLDALYEPDEQGNISVGDTVAIDTKDSVIYSSGRLVTVAGVDNIVVVDAGDAVMVCRKDRAQSVKVIVDRLRMNGREEFL